MNWADPAHTYAAGVEDGRQMEREQDALDAEVVHRAASRNAVRIVEVAVAREPKVMTTGYAGGPVPMWDGPFDLTALSEAAERALKAAADQPAWADWTEVRRDVTPAVWASVWNALCEGTRRRIIRQHGERRGAA